MDHRHSLPTELLQAIVTYLESQTYRDVFPLLDAIKQHAKPVEAEQVADDA